jgi:hypothetical protein
MKRHPTTEQWLASSTPSLAASGMLGLIRRRSVQLLAASALRDEMERFGARSEPVRGACGLDSAATARECLLDAWAAAESVRRNGEVAQ